MHEFDYGHTIRPFDGESLSGDAVMCHETEQGLFLCIIDVLGHGPEAHDAVLPIIKDLHAHWSPNVQQTMLAMHLHAKGTRGAAIGMCYVAADQPELTYVGVGNTVIRRLGDSESRLVSQDGILGQNTRSLKVQSLKLHPRDVVLLYTDGIKSHFELREYPQLLSDDARTISSTIVKRFGRSHDDAACIAMRFKR